MYRWTVQLNEDFVDDHGWDGLKIHDDGNVLEVIRNPDDVAIWIIK